MCSNVLIVQLFVVGCSVNSSQKLKCEHIGFTTVLPKMCISDLHIRKRANCKKICSCDNEQNPRPAATLLSVTAVSCAPKQSDDASTDVIADRLKAQPKGNHQRSFFAVTTVRKRPQEKCLRTMLGKHKTLAVKLYRASQITFSTLHLEL